jgi:hydrogenase maturation protease
VKPLVIGVGNDWRGDDGAGLAAARRLRASLRGRADVIERSGEAGALVEALHGRAHAIVIDAASTGAAPGTIRRFEVHAAPLPEAWDSASTHAFGVGHALELARALGDLPPRTIVYGVEAQACEPGDGLSPAVETALDELEQRVAEELEDA